LVFRVVCSDVDRLYIPRFQGGRGLKSIQTLYECRIVSLKTHLEHHKERNEHMKFIYEHEQNQSIRVGEELLNRNEINTTPEETPKIASKKLLRKAQEKKAEKYKEKVMHGYIQ